MDSCRAFHDRIAQFTAIDLDCDAGSGALAVDAPRVQGGPNRAIARPCLETLSKPVIVGFDIWTP
jgi:hypothetical protein